MKNMASLSPDKKVSAVCGLFCPSCSLYIGTAEDAKRLEIVARKFSRPVSDMKCEGCRSANVSFYCKTCLFKNCAEDRGIEFCGECAEYPCEKLAEFRKQAPHRAQLWESQEILKKEGFEKWFENRKSYHSCSSCNTLNSVYDPVCRNCGKSPSSPFFEENRKIIEPFIS